VTPAGDAHPYRELLGLPHAKALVGWSVLGRLPVGMTSLALLLLMRAEGASYGAAGIVVAVYAVALGIGAPVGGRQVDRYGPALVLQIRVVLFAGFLGVVVLLAVGDAGIGPIAVAAALAGLSMPPLSSTVRVVWPRLARAELRPTAYALEASLQEVHFLGGPLAAAALAAYAPAAAVGGAAVSCLLGTTMVARLPPVRETPAARAAGAGTLGALGSAGIRTIVTYAAVVGVGFGAVELAMPALAESYGSRELGGVAIACFSGGSLVGGLVAGMRPARSDLRRFVAGAFVLSLAMLGLQLAVSIPTLCLFAFVAGLPIAPTIGASYTLIDRSARPGTVAEAFAWFATAVSVGIAAGSAIGGLLVDERGARWSFALGAAVALCGAVLGWARRATLRASSATGARPR
jgi:MFS family permease